MGRWIAFGAFLVVFLGIFLMVVLRRQPPVIPADEVHIPVRGRIDDCMKCHGPLGSDPRGPNHPFGTQCYRCHYEGEATGP